jgi:ribokinase
MDQEPDKQVDHVRVVVVGSNMIDLLSRIPRLPKMGETLVGTHFHLGFGGKGANQAVMAARLGASVAMVTKVGSDTFGEMTRKNFEVEGISTEFVLVEQNEASGVAPILVDDQGHNMVIIVPGANMRLRSEEVRAAEPLIRGARIVVAQLEIPDDAILTAFHIAREAGVRTILNPAPAREVPDELLALTDILVPNETEAELLTGLSTEEESLKATARSLHGKGVGTVILTLGARGALLWDGQQAIQFPAPEVAAVDSTGAGDAFIGSLAYALSNGEPLEEAIDFANHAAALSVTQVGTQLSFPALDRVEDFRGRR